MEYIGFVAFDSISSLSDWRWFSLGIISWIFILEFVEWKIMVTKLGDHYQPGLYGCILDRYHIPGRTRDNPIPLAHQSVILTDRIVRNFSNPEPETMPGLFQQKSC